MNSSFSIHFLCCATPKPCSTTDTQSLIEEIKTLTSSSPTTITVPESLEISEDISGKFVMIDGTKNDLNVRLTADRLSSAGIGVKSGSISLKGPILADIFISGDTTITIELDGERKQAPYVQIKGTGKPTFKLVTSPKPNSNYYVCVGTVLTPSSNINFDSEYHYANTNDVGYMLGYDGINFELWDDLLSDTGTSNNKLIVVDAKSSDSKKNMMPIIIGVVVAVVVVIIIVVVVVVVVMKKKKKDTSSGQH
ncbi:hypothetical protein TRFO_22661 [Tritrichomonas foetus]|uniref:Uncharacterized protein n=1 Tax=Tritrichomonas foetus TaxID=1144522 RepID=A0A1J4KG49_9EUKA|nr:hypothetical protein TRFO_22661 [Tritrichomonas foetus]|eukprot:OHT08748.1 hypothetical protein TRFO_22661 [Tritrichomonas foetus]